MSDFLKTNTTLVDQGSGAVVGKGGFKIASGIAPPGVITFADGTTQSTAPVSRQVATITATFAAGVTAPQVAGQGIYNPTPVVIAPPYLSTPRDILVQLKLAFGGAGTSINAGDTCILNYVLQFNYASGLSDNLPSQYIPVSATLCNVPPAGLGPQTFTATYPYSLLAGEDLAGITVQFDLVGPDTTSANVIAIGSSSVTIFSA